MKSLNPTLWRTCKMLAGHKRIQLLRQLYEHPGQNVTELGRAVGIKRSDASQELRRIQSRGLLKSERKGLPLLYRMEPDPQVSTAAPLLRAIQTALATFPSKRDIDMCVMANGLAHERRMTIVRLLIESPRSMADLQMQLHLAPFGLSQHVLTLVNSGFAEQKKALFLFQMPPHPLAKTLIHQLKQTT